MTTMSDVPLNDNNQAAPSEPAPGSVAAPALPTSGSATAPSSPTATSGAAHHCVVAAVSLACPTENLDVVQRHLAAEVRMAKLAVDEGCLVAFRTFQEDGNLLLQEHANDVGYCAAAVADTEYELGELLYESGIHVPKPKGEAFSNFGTVHKESHNIRSATVG
eukprot:scaffold7541_cov403-Prasinococcus_capsulatus_cf.AAC.1